MKTKTQVTHEEEEVFEPPLTISEAAAAMGRDRGTIARWIKDGWLSYVKLPSGLIAVPRSEIRDALKKLTNKPRVD